MVVANILDPVHDIVDPTVWDAVHEHYPVLKPQHKAWILDTIHDVLKEHGYGDMDKWLDIYFTGSLTTFQYSDDSDVDVSLFVNTDVFPEWSRAEMIGVMVSHLDGITLPGTTHPMQGYVVPKGIRPQDLYKPGLRSGYKIEQDQWIVPPERHRSHDVQKEQNADYQYALQQADKMERLLRYEPHKAIQFWHQIHMRRQSDQKQGKGDFAQSNIIYKFLNNRGLFPQLEEAGAGHIAKTANQQILNQNMGQNLQGLPGPVNVPGHGPLQFGAHKDIQRIANEYNQANGLGPHPTDYVKVNPQHAAKVAQEYEAMQHNPHDPTVKAAYDALAQETRAQYDHAVNNGYKFEFYPDHDPYPNSPREAVLDLHQNKHMFVYPTEAGYGQGEDSHDHPLLADSGVRWGDRPVTHNDLFRAIHDFYGHAKEGVGFRADGEDNAYRQHAAMFSPLAQRAIASETRGQNSWVNFGPHGEHNQTATNDTVYAPQKAGLLPEWASDPDLHRGKTAGAPAPWSLNGEAIEKARQHLGLKMPVKVNLVQGTSGQYNDIEDGHHQIDLVTWLRPESASKQLWHEMTHARQRESQGSDWDRQLGFYNDIKTQHGYTGYSNHPWEQEARQVAESHPFSLVHGHKVASPVHKQVAKFVYDPRQHTIILGQMGDEEGQNLTHAQLANMLGPPHKDMVHGQIGDNGYAETFPRRMTGDSQINPYEAQYGAEESVRRAVPGAKFTNPAQLLRPEWDKGDPHVLYAGTPPTLQESNEPIQESTWEEFFTSNAPSEETRSLC